MLRLFNVSVCILSTLTQETADWLTNVHHLTLQYPHTDMHANVRIG